MTIGMYTRFFSYCQKGSPVSKTLPGEGQHAALATYYVFELVGNGFELQTYIFMVFGRVFCLVVEKEGLCVFFKTPCYHYFLFVTTDRSLLLHVPNKCGLIPTIELYKQGNAMSPTWHHTLSIVAQYTEYVFERCCRAEKKKDLGNLHNILDSREEKRKILNLATCES